MIEIGSLHTCVGALQPSHLAAVPAVLASVLVSFGVWVALLPRFSGKRALVIAHVAMVWWLAFAALEIASPGASCKLFFGALVHAAVTLLPAAWLIYVARFTFGTSDKGRVAQDRLMIAAPLVVVIIALTSDWHGQFYAPGTAIDEASKHGAMSYRWGPFFYVAGLFLYGCLAIAVVLLVRAIRAAPPAQRYHFTLLLVLTLIPILANAAYLSGVLDVTGYDPTPFLFAAAMVIYVQLLLTDRAFDISALARQQMFDRMPVPVVVLSPDHKVRATNAAASTLFGAPPPQDNAAAGPPTGALEGRAGVTALPDALTETIETLAQRLRAVASDTVSAVPVGSRLFDITFDPILPALGRRDRAMGWIVLLDDVTSAHERERHLSRLMRETQAARHAAERDHLTGLLNRRSLRPKFEAAVGLASADNRGLFGALIDIDHFKSINDTLGHDVGDLALKRLAGVLCASFRTDDHIFRLGGEEFLVLFEGPDAAALEERLAAARATLLMAEAAGERSRVPVIRFSAGIAVWPTDGDTLDGFIKAADRRLYMAKQSGRDRVVLAG